MYSSKDMLARILKGRRSAKTADASSRFKFWPQGFHGDENLIAIVDAALAESKNFIETGANVGSTLDFVARRFPDIRCFSCEPDDEAYVHAVKNCEKNSNVKLYHSGSEVFMTTLEREHSHIQKELSTFWLDAHGYGFAWPLREEVRHFTNKFEKGYMFIDDFLVPSKPEFGFDRYDDQECSFEYIASCIDAHARYRLIYPAYTEKTSKHHGLRGWGLIVFSRHPDECQEMCETLLAARLPLEPAATDRKIGNV